MPARSTMPASGGSRLLRPLLAVAALVLVAGASVATTWMITTRMHESEAQAQQAQAQGPDGPVPVTYKAPPATPVAVPAPIFFALEPFTVTVSGPADDLDRILHVGITLRVSDEQSRQRIEKYLPEVRSRVLMVLSAQPAQTIHTQQGKQDLVAAGVQAVSRPFSPLPDGQAVTDVLFTAFVVQ
jgi:flagellar protein FliL